MAHDNSNPSLIEAAIVTQIAACQFNSADAFKTVAAWADQIAPGNSGLEAFDRYSPFAFVAYEPDYPGREGDGDLRLSYDFSIVVGQTAISDGLVRCGDATHAGTNILEDLVIDALDNWHPGAGIDCDDLRFAGSSVIADLPRRRAIQMTFKANRMNVA